MEPNEHGSYGAHYPEPSSSTSTPYPTLTPSFYGAFPAGPTVHEGYVPNGSRDPVNGQSMAQAANEYRPLAERYHLLHGDPGQTKNWLFQRGNLYNTDAEAESEPDGAPMPNNFLNLQSYGHGLGDVNQPHPYFQGSGQVAVDGDEMSVDGSVTDSSPARRGSLRGRGKPRGRKGWKWALRGTEHDPKANKPPKGETPRGRPRGGSGKGGRVKKAVDPGRDFRTYLPKANEAFLNRDLEAAETWALKAVQANPEIHAAHALLSNILKEQGKELDSIAALMSGALTQRNAKNWAIVAERTLDYAGGIDRAPDPVLDQAIWCYGQAIRLDMPGKEPETYEYRAMKRDLYAQVGNWSKARAESKNLLRFQPDDLDNVRYYAWACDKTEEYSERSRAKEAYERAFEHYEHEDSFGDPDTQWSHLNVYLDLIYKMGSSPIQGITKLRSLARWFLLRKDEAFWDDYAVDDREYDMDNDRRRWVAEWQQGRTSRDPAKYGEGLPIELRVKLGLFRLKLGPLGLEEALRHFEQLLALASQAGSYDDLFRLVWEGLRAQGQHQHAVKYYEAVVKAAPECLTNDDYMNLGASYRAAKRDDYAVKCYKTMISRNEEELWARVELARLYQETEQIEEGYDLVEQIAEMHRTDIIRREKLHRRPNRAPPKPPKPPTTKRKRLPTLAAAPTIESQEDPDAPPVQETPPEPAHEPTPEPPPKKQRLLLPDGTVLASEDESQEPDRPFEPAGAPSYGEISLGQDDTETGLFLWNSQVQKTDHVSKRTLERRRGPARRFHVSEDHLRNMQTQDARAQRNYERMQELWPLIEDETQEEAIQQWMECATAMHDDFRKMRIFYPTRDVQNELGKFKGYGPGTAEGRAMNALEAARDRPDADEDDDIGGTAAYFTRGGPPKPPGESVPKSLHSIPFTEWHRIFIDLALLYAKQADKDSCYDILRAGCLQCNVFYHNRELKEITQAALLCCALMFNDSETLCYVARNYIMRDELASGMSYQLLAAVNRLSYGNSGWFSAGPTQKFMLRSVKALDYPLIPEKIRHQYEWSLQRPRLDARVDLYADGKAELDAGVLLTYGHITAVANHSFTALPYYFRAFALQPENISINLSIATMYVQNAMKRQTENRQYNIAQGLSFLYRYYDLRVASGKAIDLQEAEYNVGRMWHLLGLSHLAMPAYERVLALSEKVQKEQTHGEEDQANYAQEAALALQSMYSLVGNDEAAMAIGEEWLVL